MSNKTTFLLTVAVVILLLVFAFFLGQHLETPIDSIKLEGIYAR